MSCDVYIQSGRAVLGMRVRGEGEKMEGKRDGRGTSFVYHPQVRRCRRSDFYIMTLVVQILQLLILIVNDTDFSRHLKEVGNFNCGTYPVPAISKERLSTAHVGGMGAAYASSLKFPRKFPRLFCVQFRYNPFAVVDIPLCDQERYCHPL